MWQAALTDVLSFSFMFFYYLLNESCPGTTSEISSAFTPTFFQIISRHASTAVAAVEPEKPEVPILNEALLQALKPREVVDQLNKYVYSA